MNSSNRGGGEEVKTSSSIANERIYPSMFKWLASVPNGFSIDRPITASPRIIYAAAFINESNARRGTKRSRNSDPSKGIIQLKRKYKNVGPGNVTDCDIVRQRQGCSQHPFHPS